MSEEIKEILSFKEDADYKRLSVDEMYELNKFIKQLFNYGKVKDNIIDKLDKEIERLNNIINELEKYINEEYTYDEIGMKIFDASKLQDKLKSLKEGK